MEHSCRKTCALCVFWARPTVTYGYCMCCLQCFPCLPGCKTRREWRSRFRDNEKPNGPQKWDSTNAEKVPNERTFVEKRKIYSLRHWGGIEVVPVMSMEETLKLCKRSVRTEASHSICDILGRYQNQHQLVVPQNCSEALDKSFCTQISLLPSYFARGLSAVQKCEA